MATSYHDPRARPAEGFEIDAMREDYARHIGGEASELPEFSAVIFPYYTTDSPGYAGPVGLMLWAGAPTFVTVLTVTPCGHHWVIAADYGHEAPSCGNKSLSGFVCTQDKHHTGPHYADGSHVSWEHGA